MARLYIDGNSARFTKSGLTTVNTEFFDGRKFENLEPRRLFPHTGRDRYITLLDSEGNEKAIIRNLSDLPAEQRKIIESCMEEYYLIPKITEVYECKQSFGLLRIKAQTDRGVVNIEIRNIMHSIKVLYDSRVQLRDTDDNRYEIPDLKKLDRRSQSLLDLYI